MPGGKIGFVSIVHDAADGGDLTHQISINGGPFINFETAADIAAAGFTLNLT
jgi:hypothetical protein